MSNKENILLEEVKDILLGKSYSTAIMQVAIKNKGFQCEYIDSKKGGVIILKVNGINIFTRTENAEIVEVTLA